ncbi:EamA family transporter [Bordetella bronchialis]|uniref:EamA family transporter n=1 Tax=Bordetella bronchialis TaxID=463025 RepID=UPI003CFC48BF
MNPHIYIASMLAFTTYSQVVMRWQVGKAGQLPISSGGKALFIAHLLSNPWVLSGIFATFLAGVSWMMALSKFELSYAYPFTGLVYVLVMLASFFLFGDSISTGKVVGTLVMIAGLIIVSRG